MMWIDEFSGPEERDLVQAWHSLNNVLQVQPRRITVKTAHRIAAAVRDSITLGSMIREMFPKEWAIFDEEFRASEAFVAEVRTAYDLNALVRDEKVDRGPAVEQWTSRDHGLISAFSERRELPDLLISAYPRSNGALGWSIAPWREYIEFSGKLTLAFAQYVLPRIKGHHRDTFEHIIEMLCLEENPELAELIGGSRLLMHDSGGALVRLAFQVEQRHASVATGRPFTARLGPYRDLTPDRLAE